MDYNQVISVIDNTKNMKIAVLGDFALDKYLIVDHEKYEVSLETGLQAYQIKKQRLFPGAAGTVTSNLKALGVGKVWSIGVIGDDGDGYELRRELERLGVNTKHLTQSSCRCTFTYTKPIIQQNGQVEELSRLDIKNWTYTPTFIEDEIIKNIEEVVPNIDALIVLDQVTEEDCGVVTSRVRDYLAKLGDNYPELIIYVDSRQCPSKFSNIIVKCNHHEIARVFNHEVDDNCDIKMIEQYGLQLQKKTQKPLFVTMGKNGQMVFDNCRMYKVDGIKVDGPIDTCGAGDATSSGIVCGLCGGLNLESAAFLGNVVASITIEKIGTTGTASPDEVKRRILNI